MQLNINWNFSFYFLWQKYSDGTATECDLGLKFPQVNIPNDKKIISSYLSRGNVVKMNMIVILLV